MKSFIFGLFICSAIVSCAGDMNLPDNYTIDHSSELEAINQTSLSCANAAIWQGLHLACLNVNGKANYAAEDMYWYIFKGYQPTVGGSSPDRLLPFFEMLQPTLQTKKLFLLKDVKEAIVNNHSVVISINMTEEFNWWGSFVNRDGYDPSSFGDPNKIWKLPTTTTNHAVLITAYDDVENSFSILNSYGENWGNKGRAKISTNSWGDAYEMFLTGTDNIYCQPIEKMTTTTTTIYR